MAASTAISYTTGRLLEPRRAAAQIVLATGIVGVSGCSRYFKYAGIRRRLRHSTSSSRSRGRGFPGCTPSRTGSSCRSGSASTRSRGSRTWSTSTAARCRPSATCAVRVLHLVLPAPDRRADRALREPAAAAEVKHRFDADRIRSGLLLFTLGLAKKVLLADDLARYVDPTSRRPVELGSSPRGRRRSASASRSTSTSARTPTWRSASRASSASSCRGTSTGRTAPRGRRSSGGAGT